MTKKITIAFLALALCAILLPTTVSAKKLVERPMRLSGSGVLLMTSLNPDWTGAWTGSESGQATHLGRYTLEEEGTFYFTETGGSVWVGEGTCTAANGDYFTFDVTIICGGAGEESGLMTITGGWGRFEDATGSVDLMSVTDATGAYTISGTGWIKY